MSTKPISNNLAAGTRSTHSLAVGYIVWLLGIFGAHRFYYGNQVTGTIWFFTGGLCLIGWLIDLFLMPSLEREADLRYAPGRLDYTLGWIFLTFLGVFGVHRFYMGKIWTGILWLVTGGLLGLGWLYDLWTLNEQIDEINRTQA
jgi:TM2 domain-containing membrane protein YozV